MKEWTRLSAWVAIVIGVATAIAPAFVPTLPASAGTLVLLGGLIAAAGFANMASPGLNAAFWAEALLGALLFIAPWVIDYTDLEGAAWISWVAGVLAVATGVGSIVRDRKPPRDSEPVTEV